MVFNEIILMYINSLKQKNSLVENFGKTYHFEPCKKFSFPEENFYIDKSFLENKDNLKISEKYFPLIIKMETSNIFINKEMHYTYATLTKMGENNYLVETIKQKIEVNNI